MIWTFTYDEDYMRTSNQTLFLHTDFAKNYGGQIYLYNYSVFL